MRYFLNRVDENSDGTQRVNAAVSMGAFPSEMATWLGTNLRFWMLLSHIADTRRAAAVGGVVQVCVRYAYIYCNVNAVVHLCHICS